MPGISLMNRGHVRRVVIKCGEPLLLLLFTPARFDGGDVIKRFRSLFLEWARRIHGRERRRPIILRGFSHLCFRAWRNAHDFVLRHVKPDLVQVFRDVRN